MTGPRLALAAAFCLGAAAASAQSEPQRPAAPDAAAAAATEERDIGLDLADVAGCVSAPVFSPSPTAVGPRMGDPEKDNFGFTVVGEEGCEPRRQAGRY